jgi:hypothetical protein
MVEFAQACTDAGADIYLAHGWHKTLASRSTRAVMDAACAGLTPAERVRMRKCPR